MKTHAKNTMTLTILLSSLTLVTSLAQSPPQPEFSEANFLLIPSIPEFNVDFALQWTDSAAVLFLQPYDAVILHIEMFGALRDVFIFSDPAMNRLTSWVCTSGESQEREIHSITEYTGDDIDGLKAPSGITTNAIGRLFDPEHDLLYLADRGNDRILKLAVIPEDTEVCSIRYCGSFGEEYLEWPVDIAVSAYTNEDPEDADFYIVDWGHERDTGSLLRFDKDGNYEYETDYIYHQVTGRPIFGLFRPASVACTPDSMNGFNHIYITEAVNNRFLEMESNSNDPPFMGNMEDLLQGRGFWNPGGIAFDNYGRIYVANQAASCVQAFCPEYMCPYPAIGDQDIDGYTFEFSNPLCIITDSYYGFCEALVIEWYNRQTGLRSFIITNGYGGLNDDFGFYNGQRVAPPHRSETPLPMIYALHEAYPNPFNSRCKIGFSLPDESHVTIKVFDVLGRMVRRLVDETMPAGVHSVTFKAWNLSSGTYFYTMTAGNFSKTRQIVLLR